MLGEPAEQWTKSLASAVYRFDVTHGVGLELAGGHERAVLEQVSTRVVGGVAARNALHDIAEDLVPVRGQRNNEILQPAPASVRGGRRAKQCDLLRAGIPPGGLDLQAVEVEAEADVDAGGHPHDGALVLPPVRGAGIAPHGKVLVPGVCIRKVVEQIDHRLPHLLLAVTAHPFPRLPRWLAVQLEQNCVGLVRPAVETRPHAGMLSTAWGRPLAPVGLRRNMSSPEPGSPVIMTRSPRVQEDGVVAGPQDQLSEHRQADDIRPLGRNPTIAELRERLERLPPNHPSSPRYDDGSRKAPDSESRIGELPHPDGPDSRRESAASRDLSTGDAPRIHPDGTWEWKGYTLTPAESRCADLALARCRDAEGRDAHGNYGEHGLTPAMRRIEAQLEHGELAPDTEKYALKSPDRFKEKLAKMIEAEPDAEAEELISRIFDGVRYTFTFPDQEYSSAVILACDTLAAEGFELYERKNAWADSTKAYQGINCTWMDHVSGLLFEVQMHTDASWGAKQESHDDYEVLDSRSSTSQQKARADMRQLQIFAQVAIPDEADRVPTYRKLGW